MGVVGGAFTLVAELAFHEASVGSINKITQQLEGVSAAAQNAVASFKGLGVSLAMSFSGLSGGLLGVFGNALKVADKYKQTQLDIVKVLSAHQKHLPGLGDYNDQLKFASSMMKDIVKDAREFALPEAAFAESFKGLAAVMIPKDLAGENLKMARDLSRNLMKAAPALGVDAGYVQGQLVDMVSGTSSGQGQLWERLTSEAPAMFEAAGATSTKAFNTMDAVKRVELLNNALAKFTNNSKELRDRAYSLTGMMTRVRNLFFGYESVFLKLGQMLTSLIVPVMDKILIYIEKGLGPAIKTATKMLQLFIGKEGLEGFYVNMKQASKLAGDASWARLAANMAMTVTGVIHLIHWLRKYQAFQFAEGIFSGFLSQYPRIQRALSGVVGLIGKFFSMGSKLGMIGMAVGTFTYMISGFGLVLIIMQGISKAMARMEVGAFFGALAQSDRFAKVMGRLQVVFLKIAAPIMDAIDGIAEMILVILGGAEPGDRFIRIIEAIVSGIEWLVDIFHFFYTSIKVIFAMVFEVILHMTSLVIDALKVFASGDILKMIDFAKTVPERLNFMKDETVREGKLQAGKGFFGNLFGDDEEQEKQRNISNQTNNVGKIEIKQEFKEKQEPDRIAFKVKEVLQKNITNPTQAKGVGGPQSLAYGTGDGL